MHRENISNALKVYDAVRRPFAQDVAIRSARMGNFVQFHPGYPPPGVDLEKVRQHDSRELAKLGKAIDDVWDFHYSVMPDEDWKKAKTMWDGFKQEVPAM